MEIHLFYTSLTDTEGKVMDGWMDGGMDGIRETEKEREVEL